MYIINKGVLHLICFFTTPFANSPHYYVQTLNTIVLVVIANDIYYKQRGLVFETNVQSVNFHPLTTKHNTINLWMLILSLIVINSWRSPTHLGHRFWNLFIAERKLGLVIKHCSGPKPLGYLLFDMVYLLSNKLWFCAT